MQEGKPTPLLEKRPFVYADLVPIWNAFQVLSGSRQSGMAPQPISILEMEAYCRMRGVRDTEQFIRLIQAMDQEFLAHGTRNKD